MDRQLKKRSWIRRNLLYVMLGGILLIFTAYQLLFVDYRSQLNVEREKITISTVEKGVFQEYIPRTGTATPKTTRYLDAVQSGIIREIKRETGAMLDSGDVILELSNADLELSVMRQESSLYEQMSILRNSRLQLDQNNLSQQAQLAEINYQLSLLKPQYERYKKLREKDLVSQRKFEEVKEDYQFNLKRKQIFEERFRNDSISRMHQLEQLQYSEDRMQKSLKAVRNILDDLTVRAPIRGQLSMPEMEIGQSISTGERLGRIDKLDEFKLKVPIDELYLPRIDVGQQGTTDFAGNTYNLQVTKIYPTVTEGTFEVDMEFQGESPSGIRRGQSLRIRLELGHSQQATLLPLGGFYEDTGGNWVYLVRDGEAEKHPIRVGRKNPEYFEVLSGLAPGDKVITSSYDNFGDNEVLVID